jgi:hypothetical protein
MDSNRKTALAAGLLFIAATAATAGYDNEPALTGTDYLTRIRRT